MKQDISEEFARLVHRILVREKRRTVVEVATALGMKYPTFYARINGRVPFSPGDINLLLQEVPDSRLVDCLLKSTAFAAVPRQRTGERSAPSSLLHNATRLVFEAASALREVERGLEDRPIDRAERDRIEAHVNNAERALMLLRQGLETTSAPSPDQDRRLRLVPEAS